MMRALLARRVAVILLSFLVPASAALPASQPIEASMVTGSVTSQPIGHYDFCQRFVDECNIRSKTGPAPVLTAKGWEIARQINIAVNARYVPRTDMEIYGKEEYWNYPTVAADCEDYALEKQKELVAAGFDHSDLLITVVRKQDGEGHAVLTLRTSDGDFILDNLDDEIQPWYAKPYTFLKRQATFNTGKWVTIENGRDILVGALH